MPPSPHPPHFYYYFFLGGICFLSKPTRTQKYVQKISHEQSEHMQTYTGTHTQVQAHIHTYKGRHTQTKTHNRSKHLSTHERTQPLSHHVKCQPINWPTEMAVSWATKKNHAPGDHLQNPSCRLLIQCPIIRSKLIPPPPRQRPTHSQQFCLINTQYRSGSFLPQDC